MNICFAFLYISCVCTNNLMMSPRLMLRYKRKYIILIYLKFYKWILLSIFQSSMSIFLYLQVLSMWLMSDLPWAFELIDFT